MELGEARARAKRCREVKSQGAAFTWTEDAAIALDDRITELEIEVIENDNNATSWRNNYYNLANAIHETAVTEKNQERDVPEKELEKLGNRIGELEGQRDDLEKIVIELGGVGALPIYK